MLVDRVERPLGKGVTVRGMGRARSALVGAPRRVAGVAAESGGVGHLGPADLGAALPRRGLAVHAISLEILDHSPRLLARGVRLRIPFGQSMGIRRFLLKGRWAGLTLPAAMEGTPTTVGRQDADRPAPALSRGSAQLERPYRHACDARLVEHVQKHVAPPGMLQVFRQAFADCLVDPIWFSDRSLIAALRKRAGDPVFEALRDGYNAVVDLVVDHGRALGWCATSRRKAELFMSPSGLVVVARQGVLRSMYVPGLMHSSCAPRRRHGRDRRRHARPIEVDAVLNQARGAGGGRSNDGYFDAIFRPALAAICRAPTIPTPGRATETGELARVSALSSCRTPEAWHIACAICGWGVV